MRAAGSAWLGLGVGFGTGVGFGVGFGVEVGFGGVASSVVFVEVFDLVLVSSRGRVGFVFGVLALPAFALAGGGGEGSAKTPVSKPACIDSTSET